MIIKKEPEVKFFFIFDQFWKQNPKHRFLKWKEEPKRKRFSFWLSFVLLKGEGGTKILFSSLKIKIIKYLFVILNKNKTPKNPNEWMIKEPATIWFYKFLFLFKKRNKRVYREEIITNSSRFDFIPFISISQQTNKTKNTNTNIFSAEEIDDDY